MQAIPVPSRTFRLQQSYLQVLAIIIYWIDA